MLSAVEKQAYRIPEAVYAYGIGRSKLYELIKAGAIKTAKVGGITVIPRAQLDALVSAA